MSDKPGEKQGSMERAMALFQKGSKEPLPLVLQRYKDKQDRKEEVVTQTVPFCCCLLQLV